MSQLLQLCQITAIAYEKELAAVQPLLDEEARIRSDIAKLDNRVAEAQQRSDLGSMQAIGADVIWQAWAGRARSQLNLSLAQVLARKAQVMSRVRKAFGRKTVAEELLANSEDEKKTKAAAAALQIAIDSHF
jgi:hypothetical protein